jgi:hypothetical protein
MKYKVETIRGILRDLTKEYEEKAKKVEDKYSWERGYFEGLSQGYDFALKLLEGNM